MLSPVFLHHCFRCQTFSPFKDGNNYVCPNDVSKIQNYKPKNTSTGVDYKNDDK